jgi:hypothetical protein
MTEKEGKLCHKAINGHQTRNSGLLQGIKRARCFPATPPLGMRDLHEGGRELDTGNRRTLFSKRIRCGESIPGNR